MFRLAAFAAACTLAACAGAPAVRAQAQADSLHHPAESPALKAAETGAQPIDGVAARIEDDVITESEVRELSAFQQLVDGHAKPRDQVIQELADQWIVRGEAKTASYPAPSKQDVDHAYAGLVKQFPSAADFTKRCAAAAISKSSLRRILEQQIYLARFLDYRFRPAAQVTEEQIADYYRDEFSAKLKAKGTAVPPLSSVEETIREVLVQREIDDRSAKWLDDTRSRLRLDIVNTPDRTGTTSAAGAPGLAAHGEHP